METIRVEEREPFLAAAGPLSNILEFYRSRLSDTEAREQMLTQAFLETGPARLDQLSRGLTILVGDERRIDSTQDDDYITSRSLQSPGSSRTRGADHGPSKRMVHALDALRGAWREGNSSLSGVSSEGMPSTAQRSGQTLFGRVALRAPLAGKHFRALSLCDPPSGRLGMP